MKPTLNKIQAGSTKPRRLLFPRADGELDGLPGAKIHPEIPHDARITDRFGLLDHFPDMLTGALYESRAVLLMKEQPGFCAMILRLDDAPDGAAEDLGVSAEMVRKMAGIVNDACTGQKGMWGQTGFRDFGCVFPDQDISRLTETAQDLNRKIRGRCGLSISIGAAVHPFLSYEPSDLFDNARKALDHAAFLGPGAMVFTDGVTLNISGDNLYQNGRIRQAMAEYEKGLCLDPDNMNLHNSLGVCHGVLQEYDQALSRFNTAMGIDPEDAMAHYNSGHVHMMQGNMDAALACFQTAESKDKDIFEVVFQLGRLHLDMNRPGQAADYLRKAYALKPDSPGAHRLLGHALKAVGDNGQALFHYKKAVRLHPSDAESLSAMGYLYQLKGENPEIALLFCRKSVEICSENGEFWKVLGQVFQMQDKPEEAMEAFEKAGSLGKDTSDFLETVKRKMA